MCKDAYPNNHGGEFTNYLNHPIKCRKVAINEMFYIPYLWDNVRASSNYILIKINGVESIAYVAVGRYDDIRQLVEAILECINTEIMKRMNLSESRDWVLRRGSWMRTAPSWFYFVDDGNVNKSQASIKDPKWQFLQPPGWDPDLMDGRYLGAVIRDSRVVFKPRNKGFNLEFAPCQELAYLIGTALNYQSLVWLRCSSRSVIQKFIHKHVSDGYKIQDEYKHKDWYQYIDQDLAVQHSFDMSRNTLKTIWLFCNIVAPTIVGHDTLAPLLRIIPADSIHESHSNHTFINPQFKKSNQIRVDSVKIWLCEEAPHLREFVPLNINGDVHIRLECLTTSTIP